MAKNKPNIPNPVPPSAPGGGIGNPGGAAGGTEEICPPNHCTITSETIHTSPAPRSRTRIGVGERVTLTVAPAPATWSTGFGGTLSATSGESVEFTAGDAAGNVTITAETGGCSCSIALEIVAPTGVSMVREDARGFFHTWRHASAGFVARVHLLPDDVNFDALEYLEEEVGAVGEDFCTFMNGKGHSPNTDWLPLSDVVVPGHGSQSGIDVATIDMTVTGPLSPGKVTWSIPWLYRLSGDVSSHRFATIDQVADMDATGSVTIRKAGAEVTKGYTEASSTMDRTPPTIQE